MRPLVMFFVRSFGLAGLLRQRNSGRCLHLDAPSSSYQAAFEIQQGLGYLTATRGESLVKMNSTLRFLRLPSGVRLEARG